MKQIIDILLQRSASHWSWGFEVTGGEGKPVTIHRVRTPFDVFAMRTLNGNENSVADREGNSGG